MHARGGVLYPYAHVWLSRHSKGTAVCTLWSSYEIYRLHLVETTECATDSASYSYSYYSYR